MNHNLKEILRITAPLLSITIFIYMLSKDDPCKHNIDIVRKEECRGIIRNKFILKTKGSPHYLVTDSDSLRVNFYDMAYDYAQPGDELIKLKGEVLVYIVRQGDTESYHPYCKGEKYWK